VEEPAVVVGVITRAHGVRGEVSVENRSDNPDRWVPGAVVHAGDRRLVVSSVRPHGGRLLVTFDGVTDRDSAERLRGSELLVPITELPALADGEWWPHDLEGCRVVTEAGRELGRVREVIFNPANDLWVAVDEAGVETLVPALKDLLVDVDLAARVIVVRHVAGLTAPDEEEDAEA
jgi:16S rRNA processing protein RimM